MGSANGDTTRNRTHVLWFAVLVGVVLAGALAAVAQLGLGPPDAAQTGAPVRAAAAFDAAPGPQLYVATAGHTTGYGGTNWRTDLEVHSAGATQANYTVELLKRDTDNMHPQSASFSLGSGNSMRYNDIVDSVFHFEGAGALRVTSTSGTIVVTSRTYNLQPGGTYGQFVPAPSESEAAGYGEHARIIQLSHDPSGTTGFRTNLGIVNVGPSNHTVRVDLYTSSGLFLGTVPSALTTLRPFEQKEISKVFEKVGAGNVPDGYAILQTATPGAHFFCYCSVVDNRTGDPIFIPGFRLSGGSGPPPTPTPTPTVQPGGVNLFLGTPDGWPSCVVCNYRDNCCPPSVELLSTIYQTRIFFAVGNSGSATATGPFRIGINFDGVLKWFIDYPNSAGIAPGHGEIFRTTIGAQDKTGTHTITVHADSKDAIHETNEGDNSCSFTGDWQPIVFAPEHSGPGIAAEVGHTGQAAPVALSPSEYTVTHFELTGKGN